MRTLLHTLKTARNTIVRYDLDDADLLARLDRAIRYLATR